MFNYHVFAGGNYYPDGGADDHAGAFDTTEGARAYALAQSKRRRWAHVAMLDAYGTFEVIARYFHGVETDL